MVKKGEIDIFHVGNEWSIHRGNVGEEIVSPTYMGDMFFLLKGKMAKSSNKTQSD